MEIHKVIFASDDNPTYLEFWHLTAKLWQHFGFHPVLMKIGEKNHMPRETAYGTVIDIKASDLASTALQSQIVRMWGAKYFPNENCLISDIDMFPCQRSYFADNAAPHSDDKVIIYSADAYGDTDLRYPMCYILANSNTFNEIIDYNRSYEDFVKECVDTNWGWNTDELYFAAKLKEKIKNERKVLLNREWPNGIALNRLDRVSWHYKYTDLRDHKFIDCHSLRPKKFYEAQIQEIIKILTEKKVVC